MRDEKEMKVIDLFCGAGGFSKGFKQAGFTIVEGYDIWDDAICTYNENFDGAGKRKDVTAGGIKFFPPVDVVIGSPPCVDFSTANPNKNVLDGMLLVYRFLEVVCFIKPKFWVMENVPQVSKFLPKSIAPTKAVLNSADFGVPQARKRCFVGNFPVPKQTHSRHNTLDHLPRWVTLREALKDVPEGKTAVLNEETLSRHTHQLKNILCDGDLDKPAPTMLANERSSFGFQTIILPKPNGGFRRLTLPEARRVMGFPDSYILTGTISDRYAQLGNAVCPPVAKAIANSIKDLRYDGKES